MTRSSTSELFTPYKEPEREFRSLRRHFKTLSLDELRSPDFNLLSDQKYSEEEEAEAMVETMEQYMSKPEQTMDREVISRWLINEPTGLIKTWEDLKTNFLNKYCPPGRTAKKMEEINNFQQESDETLFKALERFKELLMKCPQHYLTEIQEHNGTSRGRSTKTSDGMDAIQAQLNNLGREIKKVNEKVYAAQVGCE
ncbi:hypothetical protein Tco_0676702 [Tanacetum coccineum]